MDTGPITERRRLGDRFVVEREVGRGGAGDGGSALAGGRGTGAGRSGRGSVFGGAGGVRVYERMQFNPIFVNTVTELRRAGQQSVWLYFRRRIS